MSRAHVCLAGLVVAYAVLILVVDDGTSLYHRSMYMLSRTTWYNANARPPMLLVCVVAGWSCTVHVCRRAGLALDLVLTPGPTLPAAQTRRAATTLLNVVLSAHLAHFLIERSFGADQAEWYLLCSLALNLAFVALFLWPPALGEFVDACARSGAGLRARDKLDEDMPSELQGAGVVQDNFGGATKRGPASSCAGPAGGGVGRQDDDGSARRGVLFPEQRSSLARTIAESLMAPFGPVTFWHVIVADFATSLAKALGDVQVVACVAWSSGFYSGGGEAPLWEQFRPVCKASKMNAFCVALPFWVRFAQCLRCHHDSGEKRHLVNAMKYATALPLVYLGFVEKARSLAASAAPILAGAARVGARPSAVAAAAAAAWAADGERLRSWLILGAAVNSSCTLVWDVVVDWGLLRPKRRTLVLASRSRAFANAAYGGLMVFNCALRFVWAASVFGHHPVEQRGAGMFFFEVFEILRRIVWAVFRIENEYITLGLPLASEAAAA
ncbi:EXS family-domain-containing protein [Pelagophyceae sp. CCMP2097]|nr:EXS family-domain-containing protein [Pelagophyceae sp. CCMP2097]